jgi:hypothetical protein
VGWGEKLVTDLGQMPSCVQVEELQAVEGQSGEMAVSLLRRAPYRQTQLVGGWGEGEGG